MKHTQGKRCLSVLLALVMLLGLLPAMGTTAQAASLTGQIELTVNADSNDSGYTWTVDSTNQTATLALNDYTGGPFYIDGTDTGSDKYDITVVLTGDNTIDITADKTWNGIEIKADSSASSAKSLTVSGSGKLSITRNGTVTGIKAHYIPLTISSGSVDMNFNATANNQSIYGVDCRGGNFTLGADATLNITIGIGTYGNTGLNGIYTQNADATINGALTIKGTGNVASADGISGADNLTFGGKKDVEIDFPISNNHIAVAASTVTYTYKGSDWIKALENPNGEKVEQQAYDLEGYSDSDAITKLYSYGEHITIAKCGPSYFRYHYFETACKSVTEHTDSNSDYECDNCGQRLVVKTQPVQSGSVAPADGATATVNWVMQDVYNTESSNLTLNSNAVYFTYLKGDGTWSTTWSGLSNLNSYISGLSATVGEDGRSVVFTESTAKARNEVLKLSLTYRIGSYENGNYLLKFETEPFQVSFGEVVTVNLAGVPEPTQRQEYSKDISGITGASGYTISGISYFDKTAGRWLGSSPASASDDVTVYISYSDVEEGKSLSKLNAKVNGKDAQVEEGTNRISWYYGTPKAAAPIPAATVGNVTVSGSVGVPLSGTNVTITLTDDTFASALSGNWITNLPDGLTQSVSRVSDTQAKITISGTPTKKSTGTMAITIPADNLVSNADLYVVANEDAKFIIVVDLTFTDSDDYDIPAGIVGTSITPINVSNTVAGGTAPYSFSKVSGPEWLTVSEYGRISGTRPAAAAEATTATIKVTDSADASKTIDIAVGEVKAELTFTDSDTYDIPEGIVNTAITEIDVSGAVAGGFSPYSFSKVSGPDWLNVSADGKITGTRPAEATAATDALIRVTDNAGFSDTIVIKVGAVTSAVAPAAPQNPVWAGTTAKWDAVDGAEQYRVILYANDSSAPGGFIVISNTYISATSKDFSEYMLPGMYYSFGVAAIKNGVTSRFAESAVMKMDGDISTITGFTWNGNTVSWNAVKDATGYDIWIMKDDKQYGSVQSVVGASFDLTEVINKGGDGSYYLMVKAYKLKSGNYLATGTSTSITVGGFSVSGQVASYNGKNDFTVTLYETGTTTEKGKVTVTGTGASGQATQDFTLNGVAPGTYDLVVTKPGHLTYTITGVKVESGNVDLTADTSKAYSTITLLAGNMDGNNAINLQDLNQFRSNFGKAGSSITNSNADIDGNATVNLQDLNVFRSNFGKTTTDCTKPYTE